ncbi:proton-coupled amino acid transporter-like protein CG1139 isoform X1 [Tribolium madens]|uniref:proton-coupled amino acid transporter-like protein CG1139 isoform X1 n=1 Tax=Tribolium madens TaxID=41895 RepID=UPI001CF72FB4|nr:proton-coupled amino acid transporter-like protein CG1139 isoform X1 [Tribolium madens]
MDIQETTRPFLVVRGANVTGVKKPTNYVETLIHAIKAYVGSGIFAMGAALMNSGMLLGPVLLLIIALINLHCQHLLIKACVKIAEKETVPVLPSFAETVQYTFEDSNSEWLKKHSKAFGIITDVFIIAAEYGFCVVYFIFVSKHLGEIAEAYNWKQDYRVILAIILFPMWLSTFLGNLKLLTPVSLIANIIMWIGIALVLYYSVANLDITTTKRNLISHPEKLPLFFGMVLFAFEGITFIIPLQMEMKEPRFFTSPCGILNVTMVVIIILYSLVGIFAYLMWGDKVKGSAFLNLPQDEGLAIATKILISVGIMFTFALHMYIPFEIAYPQFYKKWGPFNHPILIMHIYRSVAVLITYGLANISANLATFISLIGALTGAFLALFLPALLELVILYGSLTYFVIVKDVIIIIIAVGAAITGTVMSIMSIIQEYKNK